MIEFRTGGILIDDADELPHPPKRIKALYCDFETSSNDPKKKSLNPWQRANCSVIGAAVTWDDCPRSFFVRRELLLTGWMRDVFAQSDSWRNHNVKYDVHVAGNDLGLEFVGELHDTISKTKIYDADRRYGYTLDVLSKELLDKDISYLEKRFAPSLLTTGPIDGRNKDYAKIPIDFLAEYACVDALTARELDVWLDGQLPAESAWVWENECKLTQVLVDMERRGMWADKSEVKIAKLLALHRLMQIQEQLNKLVKNTPINPTSYKDCSDLLHNCYGYPKIWPEGPNIDKTKVGPTLNGATLQKYIRMGLPYTEVVKLIYEYRKTNHTVNLFWTPWLEMADEDGTLHPSYNQNVRSGRLSCRRPNAQQLHSAAKAQVRARKGRKLLCWDYSQLEYRWMAHYLGNERAIKSYNEDPKTDWHQWVADELCGRIQRRPAKTLNFTIGFGGGKKRVVSMLSMDPDIIAMAKTREESIESIALGIYHRYHRNLPELRRHTEWAENAALRRGYVSTLYGRRLTLPPAFARKGFNRVIQSTAADNAKEALVLASPTFNKLLRDLDIHLVAQVHDEFVYDFPDDEDAIRLGRAEITRCLELPSHRCKVPITANHGAPSDNWKDAKPD